MTVTGKTMRQNLKNVKFNKNQKVMRTHNQPLSPDGGVVGLKGNLAPDGAIVKVAGLKKLQFTGKARCFDTEEAAYKAVKNKKYKDGDIIIIRYEGPKGGPGMREMLKPTSAIMGLGLGDKVAFITDGRFSGGTHGFVVGHISPEAADGGPLALVEDGDLILIDAKNDKLTLKVDDNEMKKRRLAWQSPIKTPKKGVLSKYAKSVGSASLGAITD